jgi:cyanophycinase
MKTLLLVVGLTGLTGGGEPGGTRPALQDPGILVIVGGGLSSSNEAIYRSILEGRSGDGPLCVLPTAGAEPEDSARSAVSRFDAWGGEGAAVAVLLSEENAEDAYSPEMVAQLQGCSGFFFTGGVQSRILRVFRPEGEETPALQAIVHRWREGAVVSGSSAGAAMISDPMLAGGSLGNLELTPGLGFLPGVLVDQHFLARGRIGRLLDAVLDSRGLPLGAGIDEDTALLVRGSVFEVVGRSGVILLDARNASRTGADGESQAFSGVQMELLGAGDRYHMDSRQVEVAPSKDPFEGSAGSEEEGEEEGSRIFERWVFLHLLEEGRGLESGVTFEGGHLRFEPGNGFRRVAYPDTSGEGPAGSRAGLSVGPYGIEGTLPRNRGNREDR